MSRFLVQTPEPDHTGLVGNVYFQGGVAEVDDVVHAAELGYMRAAGYHIQAVGSAGADEMIEAAGLAVDEPAPDEPIAGATGPEVVKPKKAAAVGDWRAYAQSQGMSAEDADAMTKNQLVERFADSEEENQ